MIKTEKTIHFTLLITCTSPDCWSTCLIHLTEPEAELEPEFPPLPIAPTCAISNPIPTGRNTERTRRRDPPSRTVLHLKLEAVLKLAFLHTKTAPRLLNLASLSILAKSLRPQSTTMKSMPTSSSITSSASPTIISGVMPASTILSAYSNLDCSSVTMHTCLPPVWRLATAKPILVAIIPPFDHVSTMKFAFQPAAMAETSSATPDSW